MNQKASNHTDPLGLAALGIVFGDIGTSPLYTLKTVLSMTVGTPTPAIVLGVLSLIVWTLIIITSVKYVTFAMSIDNDGEGGILALMSLLGTKKHQRPVIVAIGLFGAALIYGDGAITPAISVLSALEGLNIATPAVGPYVLPAALVILVALFAIQPQGTARIGKAFGPIMCVWFLAIAVMGVAGIARHPGVLAALNPLYGLQYLLSNGFVSFLILGGVFLCVTGAEALYADMGHFGSRPIRFTWSIIVLPSLLLNYAGQSAIVLEGTPTTDNIFYRLCPELLLIPFVILATIATIIASQAIITGAFSMTRQAIQLGWLPRYVDRTDVSRGLWPDLRRGRQLATDDSHGLPDPVFRQVRQSGCRLRYRGICDDDIDLGPIIYRDARYMGLELVDERRGRRCVLLHRRGFLLCESRQGGSGRLRSAASGRIGLWDHADLAPRIR